MNVISESWIGSVQPVRNKGMEILLELRTMALNVEVSRNLQEEFHKEETRTGCRVVH